MKRMIFAVVMGLFIGGVAHAEDGVQPAQQRTRVVLTAIDTSRVGADVKVAPSDYPNGVYVRVKEMFGERPVSAGIFADKLRTHGFKIAETAEKADVVFTIRSSSIDFKEVDQDADSMISGNKADAAAGIVITAVVTGGLSLLSSDYSDLNNSKPVFQSMTIFVAPTAKGSEEKTTGMTGAIKADARNAKVTRAFFELLTDEWIKAHVRKDAAAAGGEIGKVGAAIPATATVTKQ